jgi:hypothetical protein
MRKSGMARIVTSELTQIKRHRGSETEGRQKGSLTHGKRTPARVSMNMSKELKKGGLPKWPERYARRNREGKSRMLDELCEDYECERTYAIKLLSGGWPPAGGPGPPGPERRDEGIEAVVRQIWLRSGRGAGRQAGDGGTVALRVAGI